MAADRWMRRRWTAVAARARLYIVHPGSEGPLLTCKPGVALSSPCCFLLLPSAPLLSSAEKGPSPIPLARNLDQASKPGMESGSSARFGHQEEVAGGVHPGNGAHQVIPGAGMTMPAGMASLLVGRLGMQAPRGMVLPGGALTSADYGGIMSSALRAAWSGAQQQKPPPQQPQQAGGGYRAHQHKGPWTEAEDV